jgi:hypothetical protein
MPAQDAPHKDTFSRISVPPPPPRRLGRELLVDILSCSRLHEPLDTTWWLGLNPRGEMELLSVPRLSLSRRPGFWLRPALERALEDGWAELSPHDWAQHKRLVAATYYDVEGVSKETVAERLDFSQEDKYNMSSQERAARRAVSEGRSLLWNMQAWPWACWRDGRPPVGWRSRPEDDAAWTAYGRWRRLDLTGERLTPYVAP